MDNLQMNSSIEKEPKWVFLCVHVIFHIVLLS